MTSPKKSLEIQKENTLFGDLSYIEVNVEQLQKQTSRISKQLVEDIQSIKKLQGEFSGIEKEAKHASEQSRTKLSIQIRLFEEKIKNHVAAQKAEYTRLAGQINQVITSHKEINSHLSVLEGRFNEFLKNVGI